MGATYGGNGQSLTYQESASFTLNSHGGSFFLVDLLGASSIGNGFDAATFQILSNGNVVDSQSFTNVAAANAFFSNNLLSVPLASGVDNIQMAFDETMSGGEGYSFGYAASAAPEPSTWAMMLLGFATIVLVAYRRRNKALAAIVLIAK
jgi:hypothetical protein